MEEIKSKVEEVLDSYYHYLYEITSCESIDGHTKLVIYIDEGDRKKEHQRLNTLIKSHFHLISMDEEIVEDWVESYSAYHTFVIDIPKS